MWSIISVLFYVTVINSVAGQRKNVCRRFRDYYFRDISPNCWYDPDVTDTVPNIIRRHGYPLEIHESTTRDGYILTTYRIPKLENSSGTVLLEHPLSASSSVWVIEGKNSLAFVLADNGFDVWMGNFRGTHYSEKHVNLTTKSSEYWNFSFHEMGMYDVPSQIELIKNVTKSNNKIFYIGHSQGTTASYVYASMLPQQARDSLKLIVNFAPIVYSAYNRVWFRKTLCASPRIRKQLTVNMNPVPHDGVIHRTIKRYCLGIPPNVELCTWLVMTFGVMGIDVAQLNPPLIPAIITHAFAGFSQKCLSHYVQEWCSGGKFQMYDYGNRNMEYYGTNTPPEYPIKNIEVPNYMVYGGNDLLTSDTDILNFYNNLPNSTKPYGLRKIDIFNHWDFLFAKDIMEMLYDDVVRLLKST